MKDEIRRSLLDKRNRHEDVGEKSRLIKESLFSIAEYKKSGTVLFYMPIKNEVDTREMIIRALKEKSIALPVSDIENHMLIISHIDDLGGLKKGAYGVPEPKDIKEISPQELDLVIVPGIAFDRKGGRIGYGKGYYDKFLKELGIPKVALAYSFQIIDKVPAEAHDVKVDKIITEKGVIEC